MFIEYNEDTDGKTIKDSIFISYPRKIGNPKQLGLFESNRQLTTDTSFNSSKDYYVGMGRYLTDIKFGYYKLWGEKTGRNLAGTFSGKFNGVYPKYTLQFRKLNKEEVEFLSPVLDSGYQKTIYYDPNKKAYVNKETYSGDWELQNESIIDANRKANGFTWSTISTKKRS